MIIRRSSWSWSYGSWLPIQSVPIATNVISNPAQASGVQTWPAKFGQILLRTDTRFVFRNRNYWRRTFFSPGPSNPYTISWTLGEVNSIQHYGIKFIHDSWFSQVSSTNKTDSQDVSEILLKVAFNTIIS